MRKKYIFVGIVTVLGMIFFYLRLDSVRELYIKILQKNEIISHLNKDGLLDGQYIAYLKGKIYYKSYFKNGLKDGFVVKYFSNGLIENKSFYKNGKAEGEEDQYYENGNLNYKDFFRNDERDGNVFWYLKNGKLNSYWTYDIKGNTFFRVKYDALGNVHQITGLSVSPLIYTVNPNDSVTILTNGSNLKNINDLYITFANPPQLKSKIYISINNKNITKYSIVNGTILIKNAFSSSGAFSVAIDCQLLDKNDKIIYFPGFSYTMVKP